MDHDWLGLAISLGTQVSVYVALVFSSNLQPGGSGSGGCYLEPSSLLEGGRIVSVLSPGP